MIFRWFIILQNRTYRVTLAGLEALSDGAASRVPSTCFTSAGLIDNLRTASAQTWSQASLQSKRCGGHKGTIIGCATNRMRVRDNSVHRTPTHFTNINGFIGWGDSQLFYL